MIENLTVKTKYGAIRGIPSKETTAFLGIPFAKPPLGDLRFCAPKPPVPWTQPFVANRYTRNPMQRPSRNGDYSLYSEDCLYLNIWVPNGQHEKPLPVMFWIFGGGFETGGIGAKKHDQKTSLYALDLFAKETNTIVVAANYRLNVFGFLDFSFLDQRFESNLGIKDQIAALKWINSNIAFFGGDANNVTVFGESAGACSVSVLLSIPEIRTLFHKAIMQSNCFDSVYTKEEARLVAGKYLEFLDANKPEHILKASYDEIYAASQKLNEFVLHHYPGRCIYCPCIDGLLTSLPTRKDHSNTTIPIMIGSNRHEGNMVAYLDKRIKNHSQYADEMLSHVDPNERNRILAGYKKLPKKQGFGELLTDTMYAVPLSRFADRYSRNAKVYIYRMDYYPPLLGILGLKACHVVELPPLFGTLKMLGGGWLYLGDQKNAHEVGKRMRQYWGAFAHTNDPSPAALLAWPHYTQANRLVMTFNRTDRIENDPYAEKRRLYVNAQELLAKKT